MDIIGGGEHRTLDGYSVKSYYLIEESYEYHNLHTITSTGETQLQLIQF